MKRAEIWLQNLSRARTNKMASTLPSESNKYLPTSFISTVEHHTPSICGLIIRLNESGRISLKCLDCPDDLFDTLIDFTCHLTTHIDYTTDPLIDDQQMLSEIVTIKHSSLESPMPTNNTTAMAVKLNPLEKLVSAMILPIKDESILRTVNQEVDAVDIRANHALVDEKPYEQSSRCGQSFETVHKRKLHMKSEDYRKDKLKYYICEQQYLHKSSLDHHIEAKHFGKIEFTCDICQKSFPQKSCMKTHMRIHTGERPFQCSECGQTFLTSGKLTLHSRKHAGDSAKNLPTDESILPTVKLEIDEVNRMHSHPVLIEKNPNTQCRRCDQFFETEHKRKLHMTKVHYRQENLKCNICGQQYLHKSSLEHHIQAKHFGKREFTCEICQKSFPQKSYMKTHMRIHTGERPFQCSECGQQFLTSSKLRLHSRKHADDWQKPPRKNAPEKKARRKKPT